MNHLGHKPYRKRSSATAGKAVVYNGKRYDSVKLLAKAIDMSPPLVHYYMRNDKPIKGQYLDYAL